MIPNHFTLTLSEYAPTNVALKQLQYLSDSRNSVEGEFTIDKWWVVVKGECAKETSVMEKGVNVRYEEGAWLSPGLYKTVGAEIAVLVEDHPDAVDKDRAEQVLEAVKQLYK